MQATRRRIITMAGMAPLCAIAGESVVSELSDDAPRDLILSDFGSDEEFVLPGASWRGFSDRVMGGVSNVDFGKQVIEGRHCVRMTGNVTRDNGGGFIQMALDFPKASIASPYAGVELMVYGNDEDYNAHIRTADCGWYDQSYRATFHAERRWQTLRLPWSAFKPNGVKDPLDTTTIRRLGILGWMRDFDADLALGSVALYS